MRKKLVLRSETLTELATGDLRHVVGGENTVTCPSEATVCTLCDLCVYPYLTTVVDPVTERVTRTCTG